MGTDVPWRCVPEAAAKFRLTPRPISLPGVCDPAPSLSPKTAPLGSGRGRRVCARRREKKIHEQNSTGLSEITVSRLNVTKTFEQRVPIGDRWETAFDDVYNTRVIYCVYFLVFFFFFLQFIPLSLFRTRQRSAETVAPRARPTVPKLHFRAR